MLNGLEVTCLVREQVPKTEILVFTMHDNEILVQDIKGGGTGLRPQIGR